MPTHPEDERKRWGSPIDFMGVFRILRDWKKPGTRAIVEKAQTMPKQGLVSAFTYGGSYTGLLTVLQILQIPYQLVSPSIWKRALLPPKEEGAGNKDAAIQYCLDRWPGVNLKRTTRCSTSHDGMADALCLAAYGELL